MNDGNDDVKRYEIQRAFDEIGRLTDDDEWTNAKIRRLLASVSPNPDAFNQVLRWVKYLNPEEKDPGRLRDRENLNDDRFRATFIDQVWGLVNTTLATMDPLTRVAAMGVYPSAKVSGLNFEDLSTLFFTKSLQAGSFGYISGPKKKPLGVGKTDFGCLTAEMLLEDDDIVIATNTLIDVEPRHVGRIVRVWGLRDLVELAIRNLFDGKRTVAILDEFLQFVSKEKATKSDWVNLKQLMYLFRKLGITLIALAQREVEVPTAIQDMAVWHVQKQEKEIMDVRRFSDFQRVYKVPGTTLKFETSHPGSFEIGDLQVSEMHEFLVSREREAAAAGEKVNAFAIILEFLNLDENLVTRQDLKAFAKVAYCYMHLTQAEIAEICSMGDRTFSQQTVSNWLSSVKASS